MLAFMSLFKAVEFIEQSLTRRIAVEDIAKAAHLSMPHLNRLFSRALRISPASYLTRRRLCLAANMLAVSERLVLEIAMDIQFASPESFARAFKRQFFMTPSAYRKRELHFHEQLLPKISFDPDDIDPKGDNRMFIEKKFDLSELSRKILDAKGTYVLIADMDHLKEINDTIGHAAGDAALVAVCSRIESALVPGMLFFRTGGDEFTVLTGTDDLAVCEKVVKEIQSHGAEDVEYPGGTIRVTVCFGIAKIPMDASDPETACAPADAAMLEAKRAGRGGYRVASSGEA